MILLGLTGSIGMGKSTTAQLFRDLGVPVWDADAAVHALYGPDGAAAALIESAFPGCTGEAGVDRALLSERLEADPQALRRLEAIVHPLLAGERAAFLERAQADGAAVAVLDVPLLFETGGDAALDAVVVVSAPAEVQRERVLARPGMTEAKFTALLGRQLPDAEKRARADFVIDTSRGLEAARVQAAGVLSAVRRPDFRSRRSRLDGPGDARQS